MSPAATEGPPEARAGRSLDDRLTALRVDGFAAQIALAAAVVAAVTFVGWVLRLVAPGALPAALLFPAMLAVSLVGGWRAGAVAGALALIVRAWALAPRGAFALPPATAIPNYLLFIIGAAGVIAIGTYARSLVDRLERSRVALAQQDISYRTLFGTMSEGFAICEAIRDETDQLVDYTVVEINPALQ
ncbi:MAG TPA: hypothetical protein VGH15_03065, partial [Caulobacteraceae bacterium]